MRMLLGKHNTRFAFCPFFRSRAEQHTIAKQDYRARTVRNDSRCVRSLRRWEQRRFVRSSQF
jgi:hypothetical protein